ncbi:BrnT family toxin [Candidatus Daviesbacteria bacterium]|nr:BrnT family toxin [Candidatus Daviesbacteria bacterium]
MIDLSKIISFEWDKGNIDKSYQKHGITPNETEQVFTDEGVQIEKDIKHQEKETRYIAIGKNEVARILFVVFTLRKHKIRVISARIANQKERRLYEKRVKKNPQV